MKNPQQDSFRQNYDLFKVLWGLNLIFLKFLLIMSQITLSAN